MKNPIRLGKQAPFMAWVAACLGAATLSAHAATAPAQKPLMNAVAGAVPNVMLNLDNSGSMTWPFLDSYPLLDSNYENAMRSSTVNPMYYNPRIYYAPRVNADGSVWASPAGNATVGSNCNNRINYENNCTDRTPWAANTAVNFVANSNEFGARRSGTFRTWTTNYYSSTDRRVPKHWEFSIPSTNPDPSQHFRYITNCATLADCNSTNTTRRTVVDIYSNSIRVNGNTQTAVLLPAGSIRPDCGPNATTCTRAQEMANIVRWYNFYHSRMKAVTTAIGQSMANGDLSNKLRIGYSQFNNAGSGAATGIVRGVRYWNDATAAKWKTQMYNWMYALLPNGGTPSHNSVINVGNYYGNSTGGAWKNDPTSTVAVDKNVDLSCRRGYHILLSDGAWNSGTAVFPTGAISQQASVAGPAFAGKPYGTNITLGYSPSGYLTSEGTIDRTAYIPYTDNKTSSNGLADLTAHYFWGRDFSTLDNNVPPISATNNPTFWQNMTSYTIGWGLEPSGSLTWNQIYGYQAAWLAGSSPTQPSWPTGNLNSGSYDEEYRVNDFIRAGYTGGGKAYSVWSAADVASAFDQILGFITGSGNDAGVAVSGGAGSHTSLAGLLKYTTEYKTSDNSGGIKAFKLDAVGNFVNVDASGQPVPLWSTTVPPVASRQLYALSSYDPMNPGDAGNPNLRKALSASTTLGGLPSDFQALLNSDGNQKTDASFIRYILGQEGQADVNGNVYRARSSAIGASVNSPPAYVGGRLNMGYAQYGNVTGQSDYADYLLKKGNYPTSIFAATNEGMVHVLDASDQVATGGKELAAFMPKGAMAHQVALASTNFKFEFVLDGPVSEDDVYDSAGVTPEGKKEWRNIVTGAGGRAGKFAFAVESPLNEPSAANPSAPGDRLPAKDHFLWEVNNASASYGDMGYITNGPTAGQLDDGSWVTLLPSGHYAGTGKMGLYVMDALTGAQKYFLEIPALYTTGNRGLGGVVGVRDINRRLVAAYAGDALGNLWRFDLRSSGAVTTVTTATTNNGASDTPPPDGTTTNTLTSGGVTTVTTIVTKTVPAVAPATGSVTTVTTAVAVTSGRVPKVSYGKPLFTSSTAQPIYAAPTWQVHPGDDGTTCPKADRLQCGAIVVVGTGILLEDDDVTSGKANAIYGVWDPTFIGGDEVPGFQTAVIGDLVQQSIELTDNKTYGGKNFYQITENEVDWKNGKRGWYLNMGAISSAGVTTGGERIIGDAANLGSSVVLTSVFVKSTDMSVENCASSGLANAVYVVDALTGKNKLSFDVDGDYRPDTYSVAYIDVGGYTRGNIITISDGGTGGDDGIGKPNEGDPGLKPKSKCTGAKGWETGVYDSIGLYDGCPDLDKSLWTRTWRTIISPPVF
jgi:type IV pilus assembly protein PilY1